MWVSWRSAKIIPLCLKQILAEGQFWIPIPCFYLASIKQAAQLGFFYLVKAEMHLLEGPLRDSRETFELPSRDLIEDTAYYYESI